jgi:predicted phosphoribosyltransferase
MIFENRQDAGEKLAKKLLTYTDKNVVLLALPRGGVLVGHEVARAFNLKLHTIIARKIGAPGQRELGVGAIAEHDIELYDEKLLDLLGITKNDLLPVVEKEKKELQRRITLYRKGKNLPDMKGKVIILIDDGLATGITAMAAIHAIKTLHPKTIIFASPVCASDSIERIEPLVDQVICLITPFALRSVGSWYKHFDQVSDDEVVKCLQ